MSIKPTNVVNGISPASLGLEGRDVIRELVRLRDKRTCQNPECGLVWKSGMRRLDVHHIHDEDGSLTKGYDSMEYALTPGNMITLCHRCHMNLPSEIAKMVKANHKRKEKREKRQMALFRARQAKSKGVDN